jgi:predicted MPP superfamily phosphohydrolase
LQRILNPFVLVVSAILLAGYAYLAWRLTSSAPERLALAAPVLMAWSIPVVYWVGGRERTGTIDELVHGLGYLSVAWLNFVMVLTVARDVLFLVTGALPPLAGAHAALHDAGVAWVVVGALAALAAGALAALRGPRIRRVDVPIEGLHDELEGFRIVQISDLHVGPTIRAAYVRRVVEMTHRLTPDLIALTGDIVDGSVQRLADHVAPLAELGRTGRAFLVLGNHDYYAGATVWTARFEAIGLRVLRNSHAVVEHGVARLVVGGVIDFAARHSDPDARPRPDLAADGAAGAAVRLLLAHNPKIAPAAERAGFDLQLSGHTHGGQFFPWTLAIHLVHGPHAAGLSRRGRMWVYVSAGTGTWGPPVRFGTTPELTLLRLVRSPVAGAVRATRRRRAWATPGPRPWRVAWRRPCVGASSSRTAGRAPSRST